MPTTQDKLQHISDAKKLAIKAANRLGHLYHHAGDNASALKAYLGSLMIDWLQPEIHTNVCALYRRANKISLAIHHGEEAIKQMPEAGSALNNLGLAYQAAGNLESAENCFERAMSIAPPGPDVVSNLGGLLTQKNEFLKAISVLEKGRAAYPNHLSIVRRYGIALFQAEQLDEAHRTMEIALEIDSRNSADWSNLGKVLKELGDYKKAEACYVKALEIAPNDPNANWNYAVLKLLQGDYLVGFKHYEFGWQAKQRNPERKFRKPVWLGNESIVRKKIFVTVEQGYGDNMLCVRFVRLLQQQGAEVLLEATPPLKRLFGSLKDAPQIIQAGTEPSEYDLHCPMMSLPHALGISLDKLVAPAQYFYPDPQDISKHKRDSSSHRKRIGIVWSGRESPSGRSIPLQEIAQLFKLDADFIVLQKDITTQEAKFLKAFANVADVSEQLHDFYETACLISTLDLVVSIDTAVAHLAGALNVPGLVLLKKIPDWRWLTEGNTNPWFPSLRLIRQKTRNHWGSVVDEAESKIRAMLENN
jgi:Flp pilus assembly protein TadD